MKHDNRAALTCVLVLVAAWISGVHAAAPAALDERPAMAIGCDHDGTDEILEIICRRVVDEVRALAGESGLRTIDTSGLPEGRDGSDAVRAVRIDLSATRARGSFDTKTIDARLVGTYGVADHAPWESELTAKGLPRDLVHPVADALIMRVTTFLATDPGQ